jgi:HK97 family phage major capsid protein
MLYRFASLQGAQATRAKKDGDLVVRMAFSSEEPYERWFGIEVLDHSEKAVRLGRLNDGASVLFNHNANEIRGAHMPGSVAIGADRVLRGDVRLTAATQAGRETIALVESGVLTKTSVGYRIYKVIEQTKAKSADGVGAATVERELDGAAFERLLGKFSADGRGDLAAFRRELDELAGGTLERADDEPAVYRVVDWEPIENSLVTIPADPTVGVGRGLDEVAPARVRAAGNLAGPAAVSPKGKSMTVDANGAAAAIADNPNPSPQPGAGDGQPSPSAVQLEQARRKGIENLCRMAKLDDKLRDMWVSQGISVEAASDEALRVIEDRGRYNPQPASRVGLTEREAQRFSLGRAIIAAASNNWQNAGFEAECSRAVAAKINAVPDPKRFYVPFEALERQFDPSAMGQMRQALGLPMAGQRDLTASGSFLVATNNVGFIEILRNRSVAFMMGARRLSGLVGNVTIPRQSAAATATWLANEAAAAAEAQQTFVQVALSPKNVAAYTEISRQLLLQSAPAAEGIVSEDLAAVVALAADLAALEGSGASGQPTGIANTSGIGSVTGTSLASAGVIEFQTDVASANVMPARGGYVTTPAVAGLLMTRPELPTTGTERLWKGNIWNGRLFDFPAMTSNQLTAASMIFGDWNELVIGEWGVLEVEVNPFANFQAGIIGVRAIYSLDVGVRRPFAFSRATTIT